MYQLVETIKCMDGRLQHLSYHQERLNRTRNILFGSYSEISLKDCIQVPDAFANGLYRCRIIYSKEIENVEFHLHRYRKINSLRIVENNEIVYPFKFTERKNLDLLFSRRGNCDDILIIKNGVITDSYTANAVFYDGSRWLTPDTPLLPGTQRARLIDEQKIEACKITVADISGFQKAGLINAMQDLDNMPVIDICNIETG